MNIVPVYTADDIAVPLATMAQEWTSSGEFWPLDSCQKTMRSNTQFLSAAALVAGQWRGWYLATSNGADLELLFIYCDKAARGQGMGNALLADLLARARSTSKLTSVFLEVRPSNKPAIMLYEAYKFSLVSTRPRYYSNGEDALVYRLNLVSN